MKQELRSTVVVHHSSATVVVLAMRVRVAVPALVVS